MNAPANPYEGRNLPALMDLMHDLVWPDAIAMWPQTTGWWVLLGWLLALLLMALRHWWAHRRANRYRREALAQLRMIAAYAGERPTEAAANIAALLKRTAMAVYPRTQVASLYGTAWEAFLRQSAPGDAAVSQSAALLASAAYRDDIDAAALLKPARRWIEAHRADAEVSGA